MSYDLYFKSRSGAINAELFTSYFRARPHYQVSESQALYENDATGAYGVFGWGGDLAAEYEPEDGFQDLRQFDGSFNLNFARPTFFGLELVPEVTAFVEHFDLVIYDPQLETAENAEYDGDALLDSWMRNNASACSIPDIAQHVRILPGDRLRQIWDWNRRSATLQAELGDNTFVPRVILMDMDGSLKVVAVWADGIPIAVPPVDLFIAVRKRLAPGLFTRTQDMAVCELPRASELFARHANVRPDGVQVLNYLHPPAEVENFVRKLPKLKKKGQIVRFDRVIDEELVAVRN